MATTTTKFPLTIWRLLAVAVALFALFFQLGTRGLNEPDEGRFAEIGREMAASGDYLTPRLNGIEHLAKPPLTYWLIAVSVKAFGANEFAARLPAALAALGTLLAVYLLVGSARGEVTALWTVVVLLSSAQFWGMARLITTDMVMTCFVTWSVWFFWRWYISADRSWRRIALFYVFLGLGMMTKGPVAVVLPLFAVAGLRWRNDDLKLRQMCWGRGALVFLVIAAPWFVAIASVKPELWRYFVVREVVERVATTAHGRIKEWWYFGPALAIGFTPWTALLPTVAVLRGETGTARDLTRLCGSWTALGFTLFTLSQSKLPSYVLPLFPPLAVLVGAAMAKIAGVNHLAQRDLLVRVCFPISLVAFFAAVMALVLHTGTKYGLAANYRTTILVIAAAGAMVCAAALVAKRIGLFAGVLAGTTLISLLTFASTFPSFERNMGRKTSAKFFAQRIRREDPGGRQPVVSCLDFLRGLPFYLEQPVLWYHPPEKQKEDVFEFTAARDGSPQLLARPQQLRELLAGPQRVFCVATTGGFATIQRELGQPLYKLEEAGDWVLLSNQL
jgi:4-amino-4-deoxy-L-arabinose transferase-like glycosyltransferase